MQSNPHFQPAGHIPLSRAINLDEHMMCWLHRRSQYLIQWVLAQVTVDPVINIHGDVLNVSTEQQPAVQAQNPGLISLPLGSIIPRPQVNQLQDDPPPPQPQPLPQTPQPDASAHAVSGSNQGSGSPAPTLPTYQTPPPHIVSFLAQDSDPQPSSAASPRPSANTPTPSAAPPCPGAQQLCPDSSGSVIAQSTRTALNAPSADSGTALGRVDAPLQARILTEPQANESAVTPAPAQTAATGAASSGGAQNSTAPPVGQPSQADLEQQAAVLLLQPGTSAAGNGAVQQQPGSGPQLAFLPPKPPGLPANSTVPLQVQH